MRLKDACAGVELYFTAEQYQSDSRLALDELPHLGRLDTQLPPLAGEPSISRTAICEQ